MATVLRGCFWDFSPIIPSSLGSRADDIIDAGKAIDNATDAGKGFDTFGQLKKLLGDAGDGNEWHHIVEQSQIAKSGFSPQQVHSVENALAVDKTIYRQISGYYSSIQSFAGGLRVRNWLAGQSFQAQYSFGLQVFRDFGVIKLH